MAEILGAVASGLAVAEVGLKVGGTVWKLKNLWQEVHEVPATIHDLMRQIELMDPILSDHEATLGNQSIALPRQLPTYNTASTVLSAAYCREALNDLRHLVEDLDGAVESEKRSRRTFARMRVVLKKDTIKGFQGRLERAIRLLQSTQVSYLAANATITGAIVSDMWTAVTEIQVQQQLMLQQLGNSNFSSSSVRSPFPVVTQHVETSPEPTLNKPRGVQRQKNSMPIPWLGSSVFGAFVVRKSEADAAGEATYTVQIQLPKWLSHKIWNASISRAYSGWQGTLSTWNIVPDDSPGMICVKSGDLDGLIDLFNRGLATPRDCGVDGLDIFTVACNFGHAHIINRLIDMNLDVSYSHVGSFFTMLALFYSTMPIGIVRRISSRGFFDYLTHVTDDFDIDPNSASVSQFICFLLVSCATYSPEVFELCLRMCFPSWRDLRPRWKQQRLMSVEITFDGWTADSFRLLISPSGPIRPIDAQAWIDDGASLLHLLFSYYLSHASEVCAGDWNTLLKEAIQATENVHQASLDSPCTGDTCRGDSSARCESTLLWALLGILDPSLVRLHEREMRHRIKELTMNLQSLMSVLASCGHDLLDFGRREADIWVGESETNKIVGDALYLGTRGHGIHHFRAVHYGAQPRDWYVETDWHYENYAGSFWHLIENPHLYMVPGAWIDEEWINEEKAKWDNPTMWHRVDEKWDLAYSQLWV